jgi:hypothetical protein
MLKEWFDVVLDHTRPFPIPSEHFDLFYKIKDKLSRDPDRGN